jgi:protein-L-isoaspartate O-methyltransferase
MHPRSFRLPHQVVQGLGARWYGQVKTRVGDGYLGWPEAAPFDAIIVTAAPARVPEPLKQQLRVGGRLVLPVGKVDQELEVITRTAVDVSGRGQRLCVDYPPSTMDPRHIGHENAANGG